jgi:LPS export ABC transporter protein LptC
MSKLQKMPLPIKWATVGLMVFLWQCHPIEETSAPPEDQNQPYLVMKQWETILKKQGRKRVIVRADSLSRLAVKSQALFAGEVRVVFLGEKGDTVSLLSASRGSVDPNGDHISVVGNVVVLASDSTRLETDSLRWDRDQERIFGDGIVSIFRPEGREHGIGFEATADLKQWTLRQVETHLTGKAQ